MILNLHSATAAVSTGLVLLLFGRRLYWVLVGAAGFAAGLVLAERFAIRQPELVILGIAVLAGLVGAVLALWLQEATVALAGFVIGGFAMASLLPATRSDSLPWLAYLIGGLIGAVLVVMLFDWALIVLSSIVGASLVTRPFAGERVIVICLFLAAALVGLTVQSLQLRRTRSPVATP